MRFEERELKPYAEPVTPDTVKAGEVNFSVQFADEDMLVPIMETWVFAGRNLGPEDVDVDRLYFQDVESYRHGIRYESATDVSWSNARSNVVDDFYLYRTAQALGKHA